MAPDYDQGVGLLESGVADKFRQEVFQGENATPTRRAGWAVG